ncbi:hypothetical protein FRC09_003866 [Ceratobasidium sp. 395]|nr:hypothetical protein FRC09_003866 [Ceratobasidium sp. 395]
MSTWNTKEPLSASRVQEQKRAEYRGESFSSCYVNSTRFDYSMVEETQTMTVGVICPGTEEYPIFVSMETKIVFALELTKDFIGQFYGPGLNLLSLPDANPSDYRKLVLAVLEVISTESLTIIGLSNLLSPPALSMSLFFHVNNRTDALSVGTSTFTYLNGTKDLWPPEAQIYSISITNLAHVVNHAVNLDLGSHISPNIFRNASVLKDVVLPNLAPRNISPDVWIGNKAQSFYYDRFPPRYQTWAQALLDEHPVKLGNPTNLPNVSTMATTYLCPMYQVKPINALLSSVFVGSATMTLSVWGIWMFLTAFLAKRIMAPRKWFQFIKLISLNLDVKYLQAYSVIVIYASRTGLLRDLGIMSMGMTYVGQSGRAQPNPMTSGGPVDSEKKSAFERPKEAQDVRHLSYASQSTTTPWDLFEKVEIMGIWINAYLLADKNYGFGSSLERMMKAPQKASG